MIALNIECIGDKALQVNELPSGDVELVISNIPGRNLFGRLSLFRTYSCNGEARIIVPKDRRCLLANTLIGNPL